MLVVHVDIAVLADRVAEFLAATVANATASLAEPGVLRFDVMRDNGDPAHVVLVEVYRDAEAAVGAQADPALRRLARHRRRADGQAPDVGDLRPGGRPPRRPTGAPAGDGSRHRRSTSVPPAGWSSAPAGPPSCGTLIDGWGSRALVCTGSRPDGHRALLARCRCPSRCSPVRGEPTVEMARAAVAAARAHGADVVVAIGGGSVLDLGKAVAMLLGNGGDPLDYLEVIGAGQPITQPAVPFIAMPTTAGTGAEVTENAVLASPEHGRKASLRSPLMMPRIALVDPLLTLGCPPAVTAASGLDALTQCLEPFVSRQASPMTDALAREGLRRASSGLRAAYLDGSDVAARTDMALCSLLGGMSLANAKLGAVHGFAGVIGGMVDAAARRDLRGAAGRRSSRSTCGRCAPGTRRAPRLARYREAAALLTGRPDADDRGRHRLDPARPWRCSAYRASARSACRPDMADEIVAKTGTASSTKGNPIVADRRRTAREALDLRR